MVQTAGFDPSVIPAGPAEGRRASEREPDSNRITPVNEGEESRADRRRTEAEDAPEVDPPTRVAFTAKFGPDTDGFPLQIVRGDDLIGAETIDFEVIAERRISRADREVLLRAQEELSAAEEAAERRREAEAAARDDSDDSPFEIDPSAREDDNAQAGLRLDVQV